MRRIRNILLLLLALTSATPSAFAQDPTTQGKEFWLSFPTNGYQYNSSYGEEWLRVQLLVSAKRDCQGTITNPNTGWTRNFSVEANNIYSIDLDKEQAYLEFDENEQIVSKGLKITTTDTVSVYCANIATYSFDVSYVMPVEGLADDYIIQTHDQSTNGDNYTSAFLIVATEDNTFVDITPSVRTLGNKPAHQEFTVTLNKGQVYQVRSNNNSSDRDLSGSRVTARDCKKIAVFNGNTLTRIPSTMQDDADCIFEQAMPVRSWGKKFIVTSSLDRGKDYVKVTSAADGNIIRRNGNVIQTLDAGQSYTFMLSSGAKSCYLESTHRCAVYLFNTSSEGSTTNPGIGAPSMVWIAPIEQRIEDITFSTFNYNNPNVSINNHYVNIIVETQDVGQVYLDNNPLPANQFELVEGNNRYSFFRKKISHGVHQLHCPNGFNAHIYGFGQARGYAYMAGSRAADLTTSILVNEANVNPNDTVTDCALGELSFAADINFIDYELLWNFGDGTTSNQNPVSHRYSSHGLYGASLTITTQESPCGGGSPVSATYPFFVDSRREEDIEIYDTLCFIQPGIYTEYGFNVPYDAPDDYEQSIPIINENGCLSHKTLHLNVNAVNDLQPQYVYECDAYEWRGHTYTSSGHYTDTVSNETCYTVYHLILDLQHNPRPKIYSTSPNTVVFADTIAVVTNTEFFSFQYDFYVEDTLDFMDEWESFDWHISKPSWMIQPYDSVEYPERHYCKVFVAEHSDDYVQLWCTARNQCKSDSTVFFLKSSFFGIEDQEASLSSFSVAPNPNNGAMDLFFENLTGRINVKVYDMRGILIDAIATDNDSGYGMLHYNMKNNSPGIYFFVATAKEGTVARKVVIQ